MANVFKNAIVPNVGNTWTAAYTAPAGKASYMIQLDIACTGNTGVQVSVRVFDFSTSQYAYIVRYAPVPEGSSIQIIDGQKIVLEAQDSVEIMCESAGQFVDAVGSLIEDINS